MFFACFLTHCETGVLIFRRSISMKNRYIFACFSRVSDLLQDWRVDFSRSISTFYAQRRVLVHYEQPQTLSCPVFKFGTPGVQYIAGLREQEGERRAEQRGQAREGARGRAGCGARCTGCGARRRGARPTPATHAISRRY